MFVEQTSDTKRLPFDETVAKHAQEYLSKHFTRSWSPAMRTVLSETHSERVTPATFRVLPSALPPRVIRAVGVVQPGQEFEA